MDSGVPPVSFKLKPFKRTFNFTGFSVRPNLAGYEDEERVLASVRKHLNTASNASSMRLGGSGGRDREGDREVIFLSCLLTDRSKR